MRENMAASQVVTIIEDCMIWASSANLTLISQPRRVKFVQLTFVPFFHLNLYGMDKVLNDIVDEVALEGDQGMLNSIH